jgi:hypothetical protein
MKYNYEDLLKPFNLKPTYCFDLLRVANKAWKENGITTLDAHYLNEGLFTKIKDIDGQEYEVTIKPAKATKV